MTAEAPVRAIGAWRNNAELMADVARLGYLDGHVLDATYGEGTFWRAWRPELLTTNDLHKPADFSDDYTAFTWDASTFDAVVFDPPYKLNGTPAMGAMDDRYGTGRRRTRDEILDDIVAGALECLRVTRRYLLVKVQDQVEGGRVRWQTDIVTDALSGPRAPESPTPTARKVDRFDLVTHPRPQPGNRRQRTARRNHSTLLVFEKEHPRP